ncbi:MAG: twin-arginine translocase TatA/TatE family subunit [Aquificaceae bacterium]|jgi:sec-independent protein translocase protein TatB|uniref:twin-arginine translocase TatA/TatE family subunit n=1 Tax=Hydrogenobacter sp. Uz 6-8 TaxID=3384828 RepID=UPI0030ADBB9B
MDFPELLVILAVAFIFLGPERMMEVATKLGEFLRKIRETWDELRYQLYMESVNKKIMEESKDVSPQADSYDLIEEAQHEEVKKENGESGTSQDAPDGASEGTQKQAD